MYGQVMGQSPLIDRLLVQLRKKIDLELRFQLDLAKVKGSMDMLFAAATVDS